jgi:hypothetical protein
MDDDKKKFSPSRRTFLVRSGILGAVAALSPALLLSSREAQALHGGLLPWSPEQLREALNALTADTLKGLAAFIVPGDDAWSHAQRMPSNTPGSVAAGADEYIARGLDAAVPLPQADAAAVLHALGSELEQTPLLVLDAGLLSPTEKWLLENLDHTLDDYLASHPVSGSTVFALLLNLLAVRVNAAALNGLLLSPFARLSWYEKARVLEELEAPDPVLVATLNQYLPEPLQSTTAAALPLLANGALNLGAFGTFNEWRAFDPHTRTLTERPLGWTLANYQPDAPPVKEGWDVFRGYYQNRRKVS